jgi:hypothetical protein
MFLILTLWKLTSELHKTFIPTSHRKHSEHCKLYKKKTNGWSSIRTVVPRLSGWSLLFTAEFQAWSQANACEICFGRSGSGKDICTSTSVFTISVLRSVLSTCYSDQETKETSLETFQKAAFFPPRNLNALETKCFYFSYIRKLETGEDTLTWRRKL